MTRYAVGMSDERVARGLRGERAETGGAGERHVRSVGAVVGTNVRRLREERLLTQAELVHLLGEMGMGWPRTKLSALEAGSRPQVSLADAILMAAALEVPVADLLVGTGVVEMAPSNSTSSLEGVHRFLSVGSPVPRFSGGRRPPASRTVQPSPFEDGAAADMELAERFDVPAKEIQYASINLFGRTLTEERDRRVRARGDLSLAQRTAHRGHVSRELAEEIRTELVRKGLV